MHLSKQAELDQKKFGHCSPRMQQRNCIETGLPGGTPNFPEIPDVFNGIELAQKIEAKP